MFFFFFLISCRFTDSDVDGILSKYNIEPQKTVNEDKARQLFRDILQQRNPESTSTIYFQLYTRCIVDNSGI